MLFKKCSNNNSVRFYCISQIKTTKRWTDSSIQQRNVIAQHVVINEILSYYCDVNLIITSSNLQRDETKVQLYDNITQIAWLRVQILLAGSLVAQLKFRSCCCQFHSFTMGRSSMLWKISFLLLWVGGQSQEFLNPGLFISPESERSFETWKSIINEQLQETEATFDLKSLLHNVFAALKSYSFPTAVAQNISQQCLQDSQLFVHNLYTNQSLWSLQSKLKKKLH